ncbi:MAG: hypothetical protein VX761_00860 [Planctomycetota bacterium]|nr:hypothetical protein [Planctomycetota bacterium]
MNNRRNRIVVLACLGAWLLGSAIAFSADQLAPDTLDHLRFSELKLGDRIVLETANSTYELKIIDTQRGSAMANRLKTGSKSESLGLVRLLGATIGKQRGGLTLVEMGVIRNGMKLELGLGDLHSTNRFQTEQITAIKINN